MAKAARKQEKQPSRYDLLVARLQRLISSPPVQRVRAVTIRKLEEEAQEDWERLLEELRSNDGLEIEEGEEGAVTIRWQVDESAW
ncbi:MULTISPECIES: DUF1654 domain-containing protein [unclassified Pseudomonas]|uniref:DUF1654 domain-containing protein n=1 Tax=unclassified Pseudomonas TaxID=196821 RepID=UPI002157B249|nr:MULTISPECIES: DUF1654 domain-containing protein [unclassified Pseudomonas]